MSFQLETQLAGRLGRTGIITTAHGAIPTPAFIPVGTKATVKSVLPETVAEIGAQAVLEMHIIFTCSQGQKLLMLPAELANL